MNTVIVLVVTGIVSAQSLPLRGVVTNKDVVTLAKAGFDEGFVIEVIQSSQRRFDTTADGVAGLLDQGISQTVVEVMIALSAPPRVPSEVSVGAGPVLPTIPRSTTWNPNVCCPQRTDGRR